MVKFEKRPGLGNPLNITVNMLVQSISKLDQVDMRYEMGVFLRSVSVQIFGES